MKKALRIAPRTACAAAALAACAALTAVPCAAAGDHPNVTPGNWQVTVKTEIEGMPNMPNMPNMPGAAPRTVTRCIKPEEIKDNQSFAEHMQDRNGKCQYTDFKSDSGKLSFSFACENGASGTSEVVFKGASYEATTKATMAPHNGRPPMTMTQHVTATRIGDC
jgi:hypothetical protein